MSRKAILLSGGVDSTAVAVIERPDLAIGVDYGQVCARAELVAAQAVADSLALPFVTVRADCSAIGSGDLGGRSAIPELAPSREWWPFRNQLLATLAGAIALARGIDLLLFGTVSSDEFHADGRPDFFHHLDNIMRFQEGSIGVTAPVIGMTSVELIAKSGAGMELFGWTHSCHTGNAPCGACRGCLKRRAVLREAGLWP